MNSKDEVKEAIKKFLANELLSKSKIKSFEKKIINQIDDQKLIEFFTWQIKLIKNYINKKENSDLFFRADIESSNLKKGKEKKTSYKKSKQIKIASLKNKLRKEEEIANKNFEELRKLNVNPIDHIISKESIWTVKKK